MDLNATYTTTDLRTGEPVTITPVVKTRTTREGVTITTIRGLAPLVASLLDAITDEADRLHTIQVLATASIAIRSEGDEKHAEGSDDMTAWRDHGRLTTGYTGTKDLTVDQVLDVAAAIRAQLA